MARHKEEEKVKDGVRPTLEAALAALAKKGTPVLTLPEMISAATEDNSGFVPTGSLSLDRALGVGGYPRGRVIEVFGAESSGKSTMALLACAQVQKSGGTAAYIDVEHSFSKDWANKLGVNTDTLLMRQPDYGEEALDVVIALTETNALDLIVVDSTAALIPKAELDGDVEKNFVGLQARMMSKALRKITAVLGKSKTVVIFINQIRLKVGVLFGNPETTPGGMALKFYSSVRLEVRALTGEENVYKDAKGDRVGHRLRVKAVKNKVAAPFRDCEFDLYFLSGVDVNSELADLAEDLKIITVSGKKITYGKQEWSGWAAFVKALAEKPDLFKEIKEAVLACPT